MSIRRRLRKAVAWAVLVTMAVAVGGSIAAYYYVTDSDTLSDLIRRKAPEFLPGCRVDVGKVRVRPFAGEITATQLLVREAGEGPGPLVARASRVQVRYDPWAMAKGRFEPREVLVVRPTLQLRRRADGTWNLQGLIADPWPIPPGGATPPIAVEEGILELAEEPDRPALTLLRDVSMTIPAGSAGGGPVGFELTAKGEVLDRVRVEGTVDRATGRVVLRAGELVRLSLSEATRDRLPASARRALELVGLAGGEVDATLAGLTYDPAAAVPIRYRASARLRRGLLRCPRLPFPISDVSVDLEARDGGLTIARAEGSDGATTLGLTGTVAAGDPAVAAFDLRLDATNLELDGRLRRYTPEEFRELWELYCPAVGRTPSTSAGRVNVAAHVSRPGPGAAIAHEVDVTCLDVSVEYKHFAYPLDHIRGTIRATPRQMTLALDTLAGNKPLRLVGTIDDPGPGAVARLAFDVESLPVDAALYRALPPEVKKVFDDFRPTGSVRCHADLERRPPLEAGDDPRGRVKIDALIDLNPGCSVTWAGLKYPVMNLTGRLEVHPNLWIFDRMRGNNGQASIEAAGRVEQLKRDSFQVALDLRAENLPFDQQLRDSLPKPWRVTWATLNPTGASDIVAKIRVDPRLPPATRDHYKVEIRPRPQTNVKLQLRREPRPGLDPGGLFEMRMDEVTGRFVFDTAPTTPPAPPTTMTDVAFTFHGSPVKFAQGRVDVKDNGEFGLGVTRLEVAGLRLDEELRRMMPPIMAQFARRLDDRPIRLIRADLGLGWSGRKDENAWCRWEDALVILVDNKVEVGTDVALEHIQGQLSPVRGSFDGRSLEVHGRADLDSVDIFGQQVTRLTADLDVKDNLSTLDRIQGAVLGGTLRGQLRSTLEASPRYALAMALDRADLQEFAKELKGHQSFKGLVSGQIEVNGQGYDPHALNGGGSARIVQGDLGTLPVALRFFNVLKLSRDTRARTAFDSAAVTFRITNGETRIDPVEFFGNAFSLQGRGTLDVRGELDVKLRLQPGRDTGHVPLFGELTRELSGQFLVVRVQGPATSPTFKPEALPGPAELLRARARNRLIKRSAPDGP